MAHTRLRIHNLTTLQKKVVISVTKEQSVSRKEGEISYDQYNLGGDSSFDLNFEMEPRLVRWWWRMVTDTETNLDVAHEVDMCRTYFINIKQTRVAGAVVCLGSLVRNKAGKVGLELKEPRLYSVSNGKPLCFILKWLPQNLQNRKMALLNSSFVESLLYSSSYFYL